ncbi:MAG: glycerophosphodiester phosphodiesterase [Acidobacteriota bacterium]
MPYYDPVCAARGSSPPVFDAPHPLVFAHRGGRALGPENTLVAFARGMAAGADGLECDVQLAADGTVVVCHDTTLERTTNASGPVAARTAAELARLDAAWHFGEQDGFPFRGQGIGIPTLADVLRAHPDARLIIEMKGSDPRLGPAVVEVVRRLDAVDRVCLGSFTPSVIRAARAAGPEVATSACQPEVQWAIYRAWLRLPLPWATPYVAFQVPEVMGPARVASQAFIRHAAREGHSVQVWTVNEPATMTRLLDWGANGLISDRPDVAVAVRDRWCAEDSR